MAYSEVWRMMLSFATDAGTALSGRAEDIDGPEAKGAP